jgi:hypothetical protein
LSSDNRVTLLSQLFPHLPPEELQAAVEEMDEKAAEICKPRLVLCEGPDYRLRRHELEKD